MTDDLLEPFLSIRMCREQVQQLYRQIAQGVQVAILLYSQVARCPHPEEQVLARMLGGQQGILPQLIYRRALAIENNKKDGVRPMNAEFLDTELISLTEECVVDQTFDIDPLSSREMIQCFPPLPDLPLPGATEISVEPMSLKKRVVDSHPWTILDVPMLRDLPMFFYEIQFLPAMIYQSPSSCGSSKRLRSHNGYNEPNVIRKIVESRFYFVFDSDLTPEKSKKVSKMYKGKVTFLPSEDDLLALGILRYGTNYDRILREYVLAHSTRLLYTRCKARLQPRVGKNPVRSAMNFALRPLRRWEALRIQQAMAKTDKNTRIFCDHNGLLHWQYVVDVFLPHRPVHYVPALFKEFMSCPVEKRIS